MPTRARPLRLTLSIVLLTVLVGTPGSAANSDVSRPTAVSPGADDRFSLLADVCPTFSWTSLPGATGYELALFDLSREQEVEGPRPEAVPREEPLWVAVIEGPGSAWTPDGARCVPQPGKYGWGVRARLASGATTDWSRPMLFELESREPPDEVNPAITLLADKLAEDPALLERVLDLADKPDSSPRSEDALQVRVSRDDEDTGPTIAAKSLALPPGSVCIRGEYGFRGDKWFDRFVAPHEFVPLTSFVGNDYSRMDGRLSWSGGSSPFSGIFVAPVHYPFYLSSAEVIFVACYYEDQDPAENLTLSWKLYRRPILSYMPQLMYEGSETSSGTQTEPTAVGTEGGIIISQDLLGEQDLYFEVTLSQDSLSSDLSFMGCRVRFSVDHLRL